MTQTTTKPGDILWCGKCGRPSTFPNPHFCEGRLPLNEFLKRLPTYAQIVKCSVSGDHSDEFLRGWVAGIKDSSDTVAKEIQNWLLQSGNIP